MAYIDPYAHLQPTEPVVPAGVATVQTGSGTHAVASVGKRMAAGVVDLLLIKLALLISLPLLGLFLGLELVRTGGTSTVSLVIRVLVAALLLWWWGLGAFRAEGRSPGKRLMGLQVVMVDGSPVTFPSLLMRDVLWRALPFIVLPTHMLPSLLDALALGAALLALSLAGEDPQHRTFYDQLAGTLVIE